MFARRTLILLVLSCRGSFIRINTVDTVNLLVKVKATDSYEPHHEKTFLMPYANSKGADQPHSLISAFVVSCN